ncbi:MAG: Hpt domain-containing protein [Hyphomicrobiaceae bacterium]|nr:Hpt domain-containing protein [Hyphomicrobiaceae bacterium]
MRPAPTASERLDGPIDHEHLSRYTLGDKSLEIEVLELFDGEAPKTLSNLRNALSAVPTDGRGWHVACHTLKGSARAVGAWRVAMAAEAAERSPRDEPEKMSAHVLAIEAALAETTAYIRAYSR